MFTPTEAELRQAEELGIDPRGMNGPEIRRAIAKCRQHAAARQAATTRISRVYQEYLTMCRELGMEVTVVSQPGAGDLTKLRQAFMNRLIAIVDQRGIVPGARVYIDFGAIGFGLAGWAKVGRRHFSPKPGDFSISLTFDGQKAASYRATAILRAVVKIEPPTN